MKRDGSQCGETHQWETDGQGFIKVFQGDTIVCAVCGHAQPTLMDHATASNRTPLVGDAGEGGIEPDVSSYWGRGKL